ncbi:hypothetical protein I8751_11320 [Nostocaceae cyanobacterium CENA357]|uniref:Uncharacterized protein n=1 Tax=Atlanticothrix silvestris CENA357 TaxID=1725252 RepID=A0A8J7L3U7_9CYAN|nr:hypothetical protein [Atlanticothrix silvestris]MBH8552947.1 hypothetical protein [Atlanticothrix silvestris CENA357]
MLHLFLLSLVVMVYLVMGYYLFNEWLFFFLQDEEMSLEQRSFSRIILVVMTIFWPIVVPFAYLELLKFHKKHKKDIDLLINQADGRITDD